ncbi:hypothetical protein BCAR13_410049 [Paraburkholderia caribensis]|uniref:hypothetical protein n=1 Tax=Paraburkholderia caribensis TaxID=75105 RepID=UPI001CB29B1E|nr:hypothetical protein [Paraburkholderia caribensis]CAG9219342.1 hypothetical protein BCAR13_410049 [Paraburkholderia caribensis]
MSSIPDDEYECLTCNRRFNSRVFNISREWERVDFECLIPEVEIEGSYGLECYCSLQCLVARRAEVMAREDVPIRRPGLEPIEICAKCGGPVDMTDCHLTYVEDETIDQWMFEVQVVSTADLAVVCRQCRPLTRADSGSFVMYENDEEIEAHQKAAPRRAGRASGSLIIVSLGATCMLDMRFDVS